MIYFASDFHLGSPNYETSNSREKEICRWLDSIKDKASEIYFLGDIFDFWFEYKAVVPKGYIRFLGKLAELNIARAIGTSDDYFLFLTRPWSLFFLLMAIVSILFPFYQNASKDSLFSKIYVPISMMVLSFPLFLMGSPVRMIIAAILLLTGSFLIYKRTISLQTI